MSTRCKPQYLLWIRLFELIIIQHDLLHLFLDHLFIQLVPTDWFFYFIFTGISRDGGSLFFPVERGIGKFDMEIFLTGSLGNIVTLIVFTLIVNGYSLFSLFLIKF